MNYISFLSLFLSTVVITKCQNVAVQLTSMKLVTKAGAVIYYEQCMLITFLLYYCSSILFKNTEQQLSIWKILEQLFSVKVQAFLKPACLSSRNIGIKLCMYKKQRLELMGFLWNSQVSMLPSSEGWYDTWKKWYFSN